MSRKYWQSYEELKSGKKHDPAEKAYDNEYPVLSLFEDDQVQTTPTRRNFLKLFGYSIASASLAASCEIPVRKAIPYLIAPEEIKPGKANHYASTFYDGVDYGSILVKVRDGRPIKIEGNGFSAISKGKATARIQASILGLYDDSRYRGPVLEGRETGWEEADKYVVTALTAARDSGGKVALVTPTVISPATKAAIREFTAAFPNVRHIQYDPVSANGILIANEWSYGRRIIPDYRFDKADLIVAFHADFLGSWLSPLEYTRQYTENKKLTDGKKSLSKHVHFEAGMSLTGSNADTRYRINRSEERLMLATLYNHLLRIEGRSTFRLPDCRIDLDPLAAELLANKGRSLVVSGSNDPENQYLVNAINEILGNVQQTVDLSLPLHVRQGIDAEMHDLVEQLDAGDYTGILFYDVNPAYDYPERQKILNGLEKVAFSVSFSTLTDETGETVSCICPDHHYLEAWNDAEFKQGHFSLQQPCIHPIFNTRQAQESLLRWAGNTASYQEYLQAYWESHLFSQSSHARFYDFWVDSLQKGVFEVPAQEVQQANNMDSSRLQTLMEGTVAPAGGEDDLEIELYQNISVGSGKHANNPWLQEIPDPVTKITWDNYAAVSPRFAESHHLETGSMINIGGVAEVPVVVQPGQSDGTLSLALGYGRTTGGIVAKGVGINAFPWIRYHNGSRIYYSDGLAIEKVDGQYDLAQTQTHHSMEGRAIIRQASLEEYMQDQAAGNHMHAEIEAEHVSLYKAHEFPGHHWGMAIDLNACTGCSACIVACSSENNVPVVGKKEVGRVHEMQWIRIDRYYEGDPENPEVLRQPVMCQHCDQAPCENVCPVAATTTSNEGLNQMAYNRCIGTRYCNNNCPYKVRRFNWFDFTMADSIRNNTRDATGMTHDLRRMALNPDVVVRAKGVIEKCSFCVQRIQEKKLNAKLEDRKPADGEIVPACAQTCPADAIVFGDLNDPESRVSKLFRDPRNYHLIEELHTLPSVGYLTRIKNRTSIT